MITLKAVIQIEHTHTQNNEIAVYSENETRTKYTIPTAQSSLSCCTKKSGYDYTIRRKM